MNRSSKSHLSCRFFLALLLTLAAGLYPAVTHAQGGPDQKVQGFRLFSLAYGHRDQSYAQAFETTASSFFQYEIVGIEPPADRSGTRAYGINNSGQVVGRDRHRRDHYQHCCQNQLTNSCHFVPPVV